MKYLAYLLALFVLVGAAQAVYVYQEQANVAVGYGTLSNGSYDDPPLSGGPTAMEYFYVNYSKPGGYTNATWQLSYGGNTTYPYNGSVGVYNVTINSSCLSQPVLQLRVGSSYSSFPTGSSRGDCYNGSSWVNVTGTISRSNTTNSTDDSQTFNVARWRDGLWDNNYSYYNVIGTQQRAYDSAYGYKGPSYVRTGAGVYEEGIWWSFNATLNITFRDENTGSILTGTTVNYYVSNGLNVFSGTTSTGSFLISDLFFDNYTVTYSATGYEQRSTRVSIDGISNNASLYLLSTSNATTILFGVYDTNTRRVSNASVYAMKKNLSGLNYYTVESCVTNARGECLMNLQLYDTFYQFNIYYNGVLKLDSDDTQLSTTTYSFIINLQSYNIADIYEVLSLMGNVTNNRTSFTFNYTDNYGIISSACLETVRRDGTYYTTVSTNCTTSSGGSLQLSFDNNTGDEWIGNGYVYLISTGTRYDVASDNSITSEFRAMFGRTGLFYFGFLLLGTMVFSALYSIVAALVIAGVGTWVFNGLGFISLGQTAVMSVVIIIVIYIVSLKRT